MNYFRKYIGVTMLLLIAVSVNAQDKLTEHTFQLNQDAEPGVGTLEDVAWLVGSWQGTAFGSQFEEVWNPASAGSMVGMFKLFDEDVSFYELMLLKQEGSSLVLLVKHFSSEFIAWEDKEDFINFKLVKIEPGAVHFSGLSFYQKGADQIDGYIVMKQKDGSKTEHPINYQRVIQ